jgi:hypothetical protein
VEGAGRPARLPRPAGRVLRRAPRGAEILACDVLDSGDLEVETRLQFILRRWQDPAATSEAFTGAALHTWRVRRTEDGWRVAAQMVDGFEDLNQSSKRLFATPDEGLNQ